ncbi:hypothetical protein I6N95_15525 [Vagococcus sp. BWB3-3]|uniref:Uncharacterized protein n=1 Tax=Vagococcus allomyrinae TaxID=2794353 RepID=A0A940PCH3_9ENTE|nr:hypothetical protein [Vagococcus allomyrinae]MBP1042429.1 hypothetical protein [Vagococcus allomyrinae]
MNVKFSLKEEVELKKYLILSNESNKDQLLQVKNKGQVIKVVFLKKNSQKKLVLEDQLISSKDIQVEEIA